MTVTGDGVPEAVFRAIYTEMNARLQFQAAQLEEPNEFLSGEEGRRSTASNRGTLERAWEPVEDEKRQSASATVRRPVPLVMA